MSPYNVRWFVGCLAAFATGCSSSSDELRPLGGDVACTKAEAKSGTVGGQCAEVMLALCTRAISDCGMPGTSLDHCQDDGIAACAGAHCATPAISSKSAIDACVADLSALSCDEFSSSNGQLPKSCVGVVKRPNAWTDPGGEGVTSTRGGTQERCE